MERRLAYASVFDVGHHRSCFPFFFFLLFFFFLEEFKTFGNGRVTFNSQAKADAAIAAMDGSGHVVIFSNYQFKLSRKNTLNRSAKVWTAEISTKEISRLRM